MSSTRDPEPPAADPAAALHHEGVTAAKRGAFEEAERAFSAALAHAPGRVDTLANLGAVRRRRGDVEGGLALLREAAERAPHLARVQLLYGNALLEEGRASEAEAPLRASLAAADGQAVRSSLGALAIARGDDASAIEHLRAARAWGAVPRATALALAAALERTSDAPGALEVLEGCADDPADDEPALSRARLLVGLGRSSDALAALQEVAAARPAGWRIELASGDVAQLRGELDKARTHYERALEAAPDHALPRAHLGMLLRMLGDGRGALAALLAADRAEPPSAFVTSNLLLQSLYDETWTPEESLARHREWAARFARIEGASPPPARALGERPLRVGLVSADFRDHAVARFLLPLLRHHDRARLELHCYSSTDRVDATTGELRRLAASFHDVERLDDDALAATLRDHHLDVVIDLAGHTDGCRLRCFAHRPAPLLVTWLGYPATTGLAEIDLRITDAIADPPGAEAHGTERLLRLPHAAWCYEPGCDVATTEALPKEGLRFAAFHGLPKLSDRSLDLWAAVLRRLPTSTLVLKRAETASHLVRDTLLRRLADRGVEAHRVELLGWSADRAAHLAAYRGVHVALDAIPYNGTTTTCDALWMGVPVVTRIGDRHVSRVSASLLHELGLDALVAHDDASFVDLACELAASEDRLRELRRSLRPRIAASTLGDGRKFAAMFERALREAYVLRAGTTPAT